MQQRKKPVTFFMSQAFGALEGTRTPGLLIRSQTLYPIALWVHNKYSIQAEDGIRTRDPHHGKVMFYH